MPLTNKQLRFMEWAKEHPKAAKKRGISSSEAKKLAKEEETRRHNGGEPKPPVNKNKLADQADNQINNYPLKRDPKKPKKNPSLSKSDKPNTSGRRVENGLLSPHVSRFDQKDHKEGGPKSGKKKRDAAVRDAITGLLNAVGLPGTALNTTRPYIAM